LGVVLPIASDDKSLREQVSVDELIRLFNILSHDLKSPIFSIDGFSELLLSDYKDKLDEDGRDFLQRVRSSAQQMKRVLDEMSHLIRLLSRPNAQRSVNLRELAEEIRLKFNYLVEGGGVTFDVPDDLPTVNADPEKLREALSALISNALVFTDREKGDRRVTLEHSRDGANYRICVVDNGIGIDPRYAAQIFEMGMKLDKSRGDGPGYGLYLTKRVIESHGGKLTVEGAPGQGSRFCFTLPA
jgi:signal transduction histidine kinase